MGDVGDDPDAELVAAARAGSRDAFEKLLRRHYDRIHGIAWQLTGSRSDADDIAQDVCCALVDKIGAFRGEAKFSTWLTGITFNACRDFRRRRRSFLGMTEKLTVLAGLAKVPDGRDAYDAIWIQSAIAKLKPAASALRAHSINSLGDCSSLQSLYPISIIPSPINSSTKEHKGSRRRLNNLKSIASALSSCLIV